MSYTILSFDGLTLPVLRRSAAEQNLGTGSAQTHFIQLPGGGYYRPRRGARSPKGIQPITASRVIKGVNAADVREQLSAWRAKIGVYGKLSVRFRDGSARWQWAELQSVDTPQSPSGLSNRQYQEITLIWQTVAQHWNGLIRGRAWRVGDGSFRLGDGTTQVGQRPNLFTLGDVTTSALLLPNNGNIDATGVVLTYTAADTQIDLVVVNQVTGQRIRWDGPLAANESLRIDARNQMLVKLGPPRALAGTADSISRAIDTVTVHTATAHGLTIGDQVEISGTQDYNGLWAVSDAPDADSFQFVVPGHLPAYGGEMAGIVRKCVDEYGAAQINDRSRWMALTPGVTNLQVTTGNTQDGHTFLVEYYDSYA